MCVCKNLTSTCGVNSGTWKRRYKKRAKWEGETEKKEKDEKR